MSASQDNKAFITGILSNTGVDFSKATFGIWVCSFQHLNYGGAVNSGYSYPKPLVEDLISAGFPITGQTFNFVSLDGKSPDIKFLLTSGVKGESNRYDYILAELSDSYFSGMKPSVVLPDMDFPGKLYRRYEVTGLVKSSITNNDILAVSGEDWVELPNSISANNTDQEYSYQDANYSGYSNQSVARYKFLYDDSGKSQPQDFYEFEFPLQLESSSIIKYRISRRSDPVGSFEVPYFTANGKVVIDYSQYKQEISGALEGATDYIFSPVKTISITKSEADSIFKEGKEIIKSLTGQYNTDESVTGIRFYRTQDGDGGQYMDFDILATGEYSDVYKASISIDRYLLNSRQNVDAYVMTGFNTGDGNNVVVPLVVGDNVYPRLIEDGQPYTNSQLSGLIDIEEVLASEIQIQDIRPNTENTDTEEEETSVLGETITQNFAAFADALNGEFSDTTSALDREGGDPNDPSSIVAVRSNQDTADISALSYENSRYPAQKNLLPNYPLPKKTYTSDYFSNYENSGESYVLVPLAEYSLNAARAAHGNESDVLGYYIGENEDGGYFRNVINTTSKGLYIEQQGFCDGQTAVYAPPNSFAVPGISVENGLITQIPSSDGVIKKLNYYKEDSWKNAFNYYYAKNYLASFDIYPSFSQSDYDGLFNQVFTEIKKRIGGPNSDLSDQDAFFSNQGTFGARIFVEREIYTEDYDQLQIRQINNSIIGSSPVPTGASQASQPEEKLYCVQSYDVSDFTENIPESFYPTQAFREIFSFDEFIPYSDFVPSAYSNSKVTTFYTGENATNGQLYFEDKNFSNKRVFRAEYVTGLASSFIYSNYSNAAVWTGSNGGTISIASPDVEKYSYHLFEYTTTGAMKLVKSNVSNSQIASITEASATVLKFQKTSIAGKAIVFTNNEGITYYYINSAPTDSSLNLIPAEKLKFNIQAYKYDVTYATQDFNWVTFNANPINDNTYGVRGGAAEQHSIPRFFQDDTEETKAAALAVIEFPNGPYTSKNYEGTPVKEEDINSLKNGLFDNIIKIIEQDGSEFEYESNCTLDIVVNGKLKKGLAPEQSSISDAQGNWISFDDSRRLRITKVRYNFYVKDLVVVGDAGFSFSSEYNAGWEYKLQYRKSPSTSWKTMGESSSFSKDKFSCISITPSPYFYKFPDFVTLRYLATTAFRTNLPLFLDDNDFEFRIAKYEKLSLSSDTVDVIKKTNFVPVGVNWSSNPDCSYYNIYQKDFFGNLTLIRTVNEQIGSALALPDISQRLVNLGVSGFGGLNGTGYYDIVVSGVKPAVLVETGTPSAAYGNTVTIGDSNDPLSLRLFENQTNFTPVAISNVYYSGILDFNNPEFRTETFEIGPKYSGFYFASSGASATISNLITGPYEAYVANLGAATVSVGSSSVPTGQVASVSTAGSVSVSTIQSNPSQTLDLEDFQDDRCLIITQGVTVTNAGSISDLTIFVVNDSASSSTITLGAASYSMPANKAGKLRFTNAPSISLQGSLLDNYTIQVDKIYRPKNSLVNFDYNSVELGTDSFSSLAFYNNRNESLALKNSSGTSVGTLQQDSFNLVSWNGTSATISQKEYFDGIRVYLRGDEVDEDSRIILKDDTEIIISYFQPNASEAEKSYFFLKDELSNRPFTIKIINGSSSFVVGRDNQDFKLVVKKNASGITYNIIYPSENPIFDISDKKEQLVLINQGSVISYNYLKSKMRSDSFVYFMNKSEGSVQFLDEDGGENKFLSQNQIAKAYIVNNSLKIELIGAPNGIDNGVFSRLSYDINPAVNMTGAINVLDLEFCGTRINLPRASEFAGKDLFLVCRNRTTPNVILPSTVLDLSAVIQTTDDAKTEDVNEVGQISQNSIALRVYRNNPSDALPSIERIKFIEDFSTSPADLVIQNDFAPNSDSVERSFYIDDSNLNSFVLRDFYNRKVPYLGNVFLPKIKEFTLKSYDTNTVFTSTVENQSQALGFNYFPDGFANGRFTVDNSRSSKIYNNSTENATTTITTSAIATDEIAINFAYDNAIVGTPRLNKNRLFKKGYVSDEVFGVYNKAEFFLPKTLSSARYNISTVANHYYYQILPQEGAVEKIILPDTMTNNYGFIVKNWTARVITVQQMSYSGSNYQYSLKPNEQKKFTFSSSWSASDDTSSLPDGIVSISQSSQFTEIDSRHPFFAFYAINGIVDPADGSLQPFFTQFIPSEPNNAVSVSIEGVAYELVDANSGTIPAASGSSLRLVCFGRTNAKIDHASIALVVNNFYLFVTVDEGFVFRGQFVDTFSNSIQNLEIVSRRNIDLSKFFRTDVVSSLPNTWFIPICGNLETFCLPNLKYGFSSAGIGESMYNKGQKIVFFNTIDCPSTAPNKVYNYSDDTTENLTALNSLIIYEVSRSGTAPNYVYSWTKQTTNLPVPQTAYAKLTGLNGLTRTTTSTIALGREFVYLPNIKRLKIDENSFVNREFGDILLFNSALNDIEIESNASKLGTHRFMKISRALNAPGTSLQNGSFYSINIGTNGSSSFSVIRETRTGDITAESINAAYSNLKQGSFIKYVNTRNLATNYFVYDESRKAVDANVANSDFAFLDIRRLNENDPNKKLFIYGSTFISDSGAAFFPYDLKILNISALGEDQKFYIFNNAIQALSISFAGGVGAISLPPRSMIEIGKNSATPCEIHSKSAFFISKSKDNLNYINKIGVSMRLDSLSSYSDLTNIQPAESRSSTCNIAITSLAGSIDYLGIFYTDGVSNYPGYIYNRRFYYFDTKLDFGFTRDDSPTERLIFRPIIKLTSTAGHYIFSSSAVTIKAQTPSSGSSFLVNNTPDDIPMTFGSVTTLYRNSVAVISSDGSIRYLKKAKQKDEFYCVLNPKTAVSTQREITLQAFIPRSYDVFPILDGEESPQQSYIKILSKNGQADYVYIPLRAYYDGTDIPTNVTENSVAYEVGIGHETIYKFLFYNPRESTYTMPGITKGFEYLVEIDNSLYRDLKSLPGEDGEIEPNLLEPIVKYNGVEYRDGQTFIGEDNPNYEIRYPNYVKVYRVIYEVNKTYPRDGSESKPSETSFEGTSQTEEVQQDTKALLIEAINTVARDRFGGPIGWTPIGKEAFWSSSGAQKDVWVVQEIAPSQTVEIAYPLGTTTSYARFVKCKVKKLNFRSPIFSYKFDFLSAFQSRREITDPRDLVVAFDSDLNDNQRRTIANAYNRYENRRDYILNDKEFNLGSVAKEDLFLESSTLDQTVKDSDFDFTIAVSKIENLPQISFDDISNQNIIKIINK